MKKTFRKAMVSTIAMLVVAVMSLTGITYAWFTQGTTTTINGIEMTVEASSGGVLVSDTTDGTWGSELTLTGVTLANAKPVSTIGGANAEWTFFVGEVNPANNAQIKTSAASAGSHYVKKVLYLKNDAATSVTVNLGTQEGKVTGIKSDVSYNGDRAARIGLRYVGVQATANNSGTALTDAGLKMGSTNGYAIFEPNSTGHFDSSITTKQSYYGVKAASGETFFASNDATASSTYIEAVTTTDQTSDITITVPAASIVTIEVYFWVEGQDIDCINAMASSNMKVGLFFEKVETPAATTAAG